MQRHPHPLAKGKRVRPGSNSPRKGDPLLTFLPNGQLIGLPCFPDAHHARPQGFDGIAQFDDRGQKEDESGGMC